MRIGSLFSGYGGLDIAASAVLGASVAWHVEFDSAPSRILAHHWRDVPNHGDVTAVDWEAVEPVDILTGGFPCQDVSLAGARAGMKDGTRSGLWSHFAAAIAAIRPRLVIIENVRGLLSAAADSSMESCPWCVGDDEGEPCLRALGAVLADLAGLGYDTRWVGLRASDAGAPHARFRIFILAQDSHLAAGSERRGAASRQAEGGRARPDASRRGGASASNSTRDAGRLGNRNGSPSTDALNDGRRREDALGSEERRTTPAGTRGEAASDAHDDGRARLGRLESEQRDAHRRSGADIAWGDFEPAVRRWEQELGRLAPSPTSPDGRGGRGRLSPAFVEWMMGLDEGHVTSPMIGLTRAQQLKALGNGVVPQQAALALTMLLEDGR